MKTHFNPNQPVRETEGLNYTRYPKKRASRPIRYCIFETIIIQCRLYRAICADMIPILVGIGDLWETLFEDVQHLTSKKQMGQIIVQATIYEPRKTVNRRDLKNTAVYSWVDMRDLKYGLEWMICSWLRQVQNEGYEKTDPEYINSPEQMDDELSYLGEMGHSQYLEFEELLRGKNLYEPDWDNICPTLEPHVMMNPTKEGSYDRLQKWRKT